MFEARLQQGSLLKKLIESVRELVNEGNIDVSSSGVSLQVCIGSLVSLGTGFHLAWTLAALALRLL